MKLLKACLFSLLMLFFSACGFHAYSWQNKDAPGENKVSFKKFKGKYVTKLNASPGDILSVSGIVEMAEGQLDISLEKNNIKLWTRRYTAMHEADSVHIPVIEEGEYQVIVKGKNAAGNFDLRYNSKPAKAIQVQVNKNLELFGLMLQLDMGPDLAASTDSTIIDGKKTTWRDWYAVGYRNYLKYKQFDSCDMMQTYRSLVSRKLYNDFFIGFLEQVDEVPLAKINATTDKESILMFSPAGDFEDGKKQAVEFLAKLNSFYTLIDFGNYLQENKNNYALIKAQVEKNLPDKNFIQTMESFYQKSFKAYNLVPVFNIPTSMGFGKMSNTTQTIYNAFGPFSFQILNQQKPDPGFDFPERIAGLSVHEFGHSFVNPAVDKLPVALIKSTEYLYLPIKEVMSKKSYTNWMMCLYEHFVKAGEILIARKLGKGGNEEADIKSSVASGSVYLPFIVKELELYDASSGPAKNYDHFVLTTLEHLKAAYPR